MIPQEHSYATIGSPVYPSKPEVQKKKKNDLESNLMEMIEVLNNEMYIFLKKYRKIKSNI